MSKGPVAPDADTFTTGDLARICRVAPRTVAKWADAGKIAFYLIPGSTHRRFLRTEVAAFLAANDMPFTVAQRLGGTNP